MKTLISWWKKRQLRLAQEKYAQLKAEKESMLARCRGNPFLFFDPDDKDYTRVCGQVAKYEERVEQLMRQ